jgi:hypothetical protein
LTPLVPAVGIAGAGRFLERRVMMILREQVSFHARAPVLIGAGLLALVAIPSRSASATAIAEQDVEIEALEAEDRGGEGQ